MTKPQDPNEGAPQGANGQGGEQKKGKGLKIALVVFAVLALMGACFGGGEESESADEKETQSERKEQEENSAEQRSESAQEGEEKATMVAEWFNDRAKRAGCHAAVQIEYGGSFMCEVEYVDVAGSENEILMLRLKDREAVEQYYEENRNRRQMNAEAVADMVVTERDTDERIQGIETISLSGPGKGGLFGTWNARAEIE